MILSKSFTNKPISSNGKKLVSYVFCEKLLSFLASRIKTRTSSFLAFSFFQFSLSMQLSNKSLASKFEYGEEEVEKVSLLDLHDLPLDCILEKLSPSELCNVAKVCKSLRKRCRSDYFWEKHMKMKWSKVFGDASYREWKCYVASRNIEKSSNQHKNHKTILDFLHGFLPFFWIKSKSENDMKSRLDDSIAALYLSLENGKFWFPAQVYNREVIIWLHANTFYSSGNYFLN
jgi:hypothetical protein